jgi:3-dehydroquinate dehydratase
METMPWENIVCEIPPGYAVGSFYWCEISLDSLETADDLVRVLSVNSSTKVIAATRAVEQGLVERKVAAALNAKVEYVLFESVSKQQTRDTITEITKRNSKSIATKHLAGEVGSAAQMVRELVGMAELGADIVKIAYFAHTPSAIALGLDALQRAQETIDKPVSITPMGTRWGRVAAAMAGSQLVFAPLLSEGDRPSADEMVGLLKQMGGPSHG